VAGPAAGHERSPYALSPRGRHCRFAHPLYALRLPLRRHRAKDRRGLGRLLCLGGRGRPLCGIARPRAADAPPIVARRRRGHRAPLRLRLEAVARTLSALRRVRAPDRSCGSPGARRAQRVLLAVQPSALAWRRHCACRRCPAGIWPFRHRRDLEPAVRARTALALTQRHLDHRARFRGTGELACVCAAELHRAAFASA
jgi:hypothetical protein